MKLGFVIPQLGPEVSAETTSAFAAAAEARGYDSLWVLDRLLFPTSLSQRYPASLDGTLPDLYRRVLDPLALLSFVAARTTSIKLGTSILNLPWYNPVLLGRMLASLDVLSNGRLQIGIGTGWSKEEYEAAGVNWSERGARTNEALQLMRTLWAEREPGFKGRYFSLPDSVIDLKPLQKPGPPVFMAAYSPAAMQRIANQGDGWMRG